jgi:hypothetical protein
MQELEGPFFSSKDYSYNGVLLIRIYLLNTTTHLGP